jgi:hypothetical protein
MEMFIIHCRLHSSALLNSFRKSSNVNKFTELAHSKTIARCFSVEFEAAISNTIAPPKFRAYIGGKYVDSTSGTEVPVYSPHTGALIANFQVSGIFTYN